MNAIPLRTDNHTAVTRASLLEGIQQGNDDRWREFFHTYGPVIRGFALKAGLTETEADEVVQETCIGVARNVAEFQYDPAKCRFKTWLLNLASWRVKNQLTKRQRWEERIHHEPACTPRISAADEPSHTSPIEELPDLSASKLDAIWDEQWRADMFKLALEKIRGQFSATQFQIFDLNVLKEWPAGRVAKSLGVTVASVYLAKHRVSTAFKREVARLERVT